MNCFPFVQEKLRDVCCEAFVLLYAIIFLIRILSVFCTQIDKGHQFGVGVKNNLYCYYCIKIGCFVHQFYDKIESGLCGDLFIV